MEALKKQRGKKWSLLSHQLPLHQFKATESPLHNKKIKIKRRRTGFWFLVQPIEEEEKMAPKIATCFTVIQVLMNHPTIKMERTRRKTREVVLVRVREERKSSALVMISGPSLLLHTKHSDPSSKRIPQRCMCHTNVDLIYTHKHTHWVDGQRQASIQVLYFTAVSKAL